jgi:hypothetical protein
VMATFVAVSGNDWILSLIGKARAWTH